MTYVPWGIGTAISMILWVGIGPLAIAYLALAFVRSAVWATGVAAFLALCACVLEPLRHFAWTLENSNRYLSTQTLILSSVQVFLFALAIFGMFILIPLAIRSVNSKKGKQ